MVLKAFDVKLVPVLVLAPFVEPLHLVQSHWGAIHRQWHFCPSGWRSLPQCLHPSHCCRACCLCRSLSFHCSWRPQSLCRIWWGVLFAGYDSSTLVHCINSKVKLTSLMLSWVNPLYLTDHPHFVYSSWISSRPAVWCGFGSKPTTHISFKSSFRSCLTSLELQLIIYSDSFAQVPSHLLSTVPFSLLTLQTPIWTGWWSLSWGSAPADRAPWLGHQGWNRRRGTHGSSHRENLHLVHYCPYVDPKSFGRFLHTDFCLL